MQYENDFNISECMIANTQAGIRYSSMLTPKPK